MTRIKWLTCSAFARTTVTLAAFGVVCPVGVAQAETASGFVFEDRNGNERRDSGEVGIEGVRVSDGRAFEVTDADGRWNLEIEDEAILFVVKPSGYRVPVDASQLPRFYYIHQPEGSPSGLRYRGIEPTGPLPESIDFALQRQDEPSTFEAILFADPQPQTEVELDYIRDDVVAELIGSQARFGLTVGDIMFDDLSLLPRYNAIVGQIGVPWYNVPGNHEMNLEAAGDQYSLETFKRTFGPTYYSFDYAEVHFVVLDNIEYQGNGASDPGDVRGDGGYIAKIGKRQLEWLKRDLSYVPDDRLVFLAMHSPLAAYTHDEPTSNTEDSAKLLSLLSGRPNLYSVAGHTHTTEHHYFGDEEGFDGPGEFHQHVLSTVSGSWWSGPFDVSGVPTTWQRDGTPNGYHLLEVDGERASVRFKAAGHAPAYQMRVLFDVAHHGLGKSGRRDFRAGELFDSRMTVDQVPAAGILVNLFDGGPRSKVSFQVDGGEPVPMGRVEREDPFIVELYSRNSDSLKGWVETLPSSHLFEADLPDDLEPGVYTIAITAVDEFGRSHHAHSVLEITGR